MSPRTVTLPPTEPTMWRKLLARAHPDGGGSHDLFIWCDHLRELVCAGGFDGGGRPHGTGAQRIGGETTRERIPFSWARSFAALTERAIKLADEVGEPYAGLLRMLEDCEPAYIGTALLQQQAGATYKQLALIAHRAGLTDKQRRDWYGVVESIPLSQRHAGHLISKLVKEAA